ncbi:hypothetical protein LMG28688_07266 [Paraburkholderia caffeinitolerans]|uniref:Uncharacterized protein n=1 Tax=Paraburkholderia caffeinitolerans TaxID=1723730 RepID=A0A6J5H3T3_9BURK|nr:hypothetical protein LMG28688_07266 [Paraburkholderia caffeinitolerans]
MPPRVPVISEPGVFTIFSCAWYIITMPRGMRWLTTARAHSAPFELKHSIQSLSTTPICAASFSEIHTIGPPRESVSMSRLSV